MQQYILGGSKLQEESMHVHRKLYLYQMMTRGVLFDDKKFGKWILDQKSFSVKIALFVVFSSFVNISKWWQHLISLPITWYHKCLEIMFTLRNTHWSNWKSFMCANPSSWRCPNPLNMQWNVHNRRQNHPSFDYNQKEFKKRYDWDK